MPIRKHKLFNRPKKLYDVAVMKEEQNLIKKYGLKNRREVWRANFAISRIRDIAKSLITAAEKEQQTFIKAQQKKGFKVETIADVLGLNKEDYLKRRLQSIVAAKKIAKTPKQARQFITHKNVLINNKAIDSPAHLTTIEEEASIECRIAIPEQKVISDEEKRILKEMQPKEVIENE